MNIDIILASESEIRATLLRNAGIEIETKPASIDEKSIRKSLSIEGATPEQVALFLAKEKACFISKTFPRALVIGSDQIVAHGQNILGKPESKGHAIMQLRALSNQQHSLFSAVSICENGVETWSFVGLVQMQMFALSNTYIDDYVFRNWDSIRHSVGCYKLEEEGVRLFSAVNGDYFHVLGLPMIELLSYLTRRGVLNL